MASAKTAHIAEISLERFFLKHRVVYYWTFTMVLICSKSEAERMFKPFKDLIRRRGKEMLEFWELQERGAWHVHLVTDAFLDVNWLRPWMMKRGWGQQMKVKRVQSSARWVQDRGAWVPDEREVAGLVRYLTKYLTKCYRIQEWSPAAFGHKKVFGGVSAQSRRSVFAGSTRFSFTKWEGKPGAMLYYYGAQLWRAIYGCCPTWRDVRAVMRMGYEDLEYANFDPFYAPP